MSKLLAGRQKDISYVRAMLIFGLTSKPAIEALLGELQPMQRQLVQDRLSVCH